MFGDVSVAQDGQLLPNLLLGEIQAVHRVSGFDLQGKKMGETDNVPSVHNERRV